MITPSSSLTATERVLPSMALDFSEAYFSAKASENTTLYITPGTGL